MGTPLSTTATRFVEARPLIHIGMIRQQSQSHVLRLPLQGASHFSHAVNQECSNRVAFGENSVEATTARARGTSRC